MKTKLTSRSAFLHSRLLLSFAFCSAGLLLALAALALYPGATALAQEAPQKNSSTQSRSSDIQPFAPLGGPTLAGQLIISEFRVRGVDGANDEFIELYNTFGFPLTTQSADGSPGLAVVASDGVARCVVPNGTVIPSGGHYLCTNSVAYSLGFYPSGSGNTATGDATFTSDIPENGGLALFNNSAGGASFSVANRLDAAGATTVAALYREGTGLPGVANFVGNYSWVRQLPGGCTGSGNPPSGDCSSVALISTTLAPTTTKLQDTNQNANDFIFLDVNGLSAGAGQRLGAPGPQNLAGPSQYDGPISEGANLRLLDTCADETSPPNYVRDATSFPANNATLGTIDLRRTFTNHGSSPITRLRFRIVDITTFPAITGVADLRPLSSDGVTFFADRPPCGSGFANAIIRGTTVETPPGQANGGGYNTSMSVDFVTPVTPLAANAPIDVRFLLGVEQNGVARFCVVSETEPETKALVSCFTPTDITPANAPNCAVTIFSESFDNVTPPNVPAGWQFGLDHGPADCTPSGICAQGSQWQTFNDSSGLANDTAPGSAYNLEASCVTDAFLDTPAIPVVAQGGSQLTFRHLILLEDGYDGGVLEISAPNINGGTFTDIISAGGSFLSGGYNRTISLNFLSPIAGRQAWSGASSGYITTKVILPPVAAGNIKLRFRLATDCSIAIGGEWLIDSVKVTAGICGPQALNISTRMQVQTGNNVLIGGFIVTGNTTKKVALRGIGPSLAQSGIPDPLADPTLEVHDSTGVVIAQNDNWQDDASSAAQLTNLGIAPSNPNESGIVTTLPPSGAYTAILAGNNGGTGVGLVEVYDVNAATGSQLANISTRGLVQTGTNVMIGGFILGGGANSRVAVRGLGPSLGVSPALADPTLELHDGNGATLVANDNWQDDPAAAAQLTSFGLALQNPNEAGIFTTLPPGNFTAIVAGKAGGTGIGLVEIYNVN